MRSILVANDKAIGWLWPLAGVTLFFYFYRVPFLYSRHFDRDELQHLHNAFNVVMGLVPYNDYFEHHPPGFVAMLSPLVSIGGPEWSTILAARVLMLVVCGGLLAICYRTWSMIGEPRAAGVGVAFLSGILLFLNKSIEIRPDVPAAFLWLLGLAYVIEAARNGHVAKYVAAGLAFGVGLMFTPKLGFGVLGMGLGLMLSHVRHGTLFGPDGHMKGMLALVGAVVVPLLLTVSALAFWGNVNGFIESVVLMSLGWERELPALHFLIVLFSQNPFITFFAAVGILQLLTESLLADEPDPSAAILGFSGAMLVLGWFLIPVPWPQYLLLVFPIGAYAAANMCIRVCDKLFREGAEILRAHWPVLAGGGLVATLAVVAVAVFTQEGGLLWANLKIGFWMAGSGMLVIGGLRLGDEKRILCWVAALTASLVAFRDLQPGSLVFLVPWLLLLIGIYLAPLRDRALALLVAVILAAPLVQMGSMSYRDNHAFRSEFEFIMRNTTAADTVLTGWHGMAVFRPHAYRYYFLHLGVQRMLSDSEKGEDVLRVLRERPPRAVIRDKSMQRLNSEVNEYILQHYEPVGVGPLWMRRPVGVTR